MTDCAAIARSPPLALSDTFIIPRMGVASMRNPSREVETLREQLEAGERGGDDADVLLHFSDRLTLLSTSYTDHRHVKLLRHCTRMAEHAPTSLTNALTDREAAEGIVRWINDTYDNPETNRDYRVAFRVFGRRATDENGTDPPDSIDWVPSGTPKSYDQAPDPATMLRWDSDVKPMIDAATNARDAALIATAFDAGARSGELYELRIGDLTSSEFGLRLRVDGKTGQRSVTLVPSEHYLTKWLGEHPATGDSTAHLWSKLGDGEQISYRRYIELFKACARRAGVTKPVTPTNFRKSNASWLARQGANAALIEDRQGRERGSKAVARYVSRFGEGDEARQYAALHGIDVGPDDTESLAPIECQRCGRETPHDEPMCVWCGRATNAVAAETADRVRSSLRTAMARSDDAGERAGILDTLEELDTNPEAAADLVQAALARDHDGSSP